MLKTKQGTGVPARILLRRVAALLALLAAILAGPARAADAAPQGCKSFDPVFSVRGERWYTDQAGSVVDHDLLMQHEAEIKPLRDYVTYLVQSLDAGQYDCVRMGLEDWAHKGALLQKPENFSGMRERLRFGTAIDFVALRMRADGKPQSEAVLTWLRTLNEQIAQDYGKRGLYDNERIWVGVAAQITALTVGDPGLRSYADDVWAHAIGNITANGSIATEVRRQGRSLLYHEYYLAALEFLSAARKSFGQAPSEAESAAIRRLYLLVRSGNCQPQDYLSATGLAIKQDPPSQDADIATLSTLAPELVSSAPLCVAAPKTAYYPLLGGDLGVVKAAIDKLTAH